MNKLGKTIYEYIKVSSITIDDIVNCERYEHTIEFICILKENMHHKYDISFKNAFYIIDLAAGIFFLKI